VIRLILLFITTSIISLNLQAQDISEQNWQTEKDFRLAENNVKENIIWLEDNPLATVSNDTKAITEYVLNWLANAPYISVTYDEVFLEGLANKKYKFADKFRITYLFGKSYYVISNPEASDEDEARASARGIEGMVKVYQELVKIDPSVKHRVLEKYSKLVRQEKLNSYAETQLAKPKVDL
jgi:hypothetical protein